MARSSARSLFPFVGRVLPLTGLIAVALHGAEGRALIEASRAELAGTLARIHELMLGR